jgi:hypothetical protein
MSLMTNISDMSMISAMSFMTAISVISMMSVMYLMTLVIVVCVIVLMPMLPISLMNVDCDLNAFLNDGDVLCFCDVHDELDGHLVCNVFYVSFLTLRCL